MSDLSIFHDDVLEVYDAADKPDGLLFMYVELVKQLEKECEHRQYLIDSLMIEHCPDDMTKAQMNNWEKHQKQTTINL